MNLDDLRASESEKALPNVSGQVAFIPWLRLKLPVHIAGVDFVPYRDADGNVSPVFRDAESSLSMIFSSYIDRDNDAIDNLVVATLPGRGWNVADGDFETVAWAARLLFLSCWAANEYFIDGGGHYVNSIPFRPIWQRFSGGPWVALTSRRRYGHSTNGGYEHGKIKFNRPLQCGIDSANVDKPLLQALDAANSAGTSSTIQRLVNALPFVELANTDDDLMNEPPEAILMGSAFEQLLDARASGHTLGSNFGEVFAKHGTVTVADALKVKPGIRIDTSTPERAAAQPMWWVHRKWIEELYSVRNKSVHEGTAAGKSWGWSPFEHLVIAAFVFPLVVKRLLEDEGLYRTTSEDIAHCKAIDNLLIADGWNRVDGEDASRWLKIVSKEENSLRFEAAFAKVFADSPDNDGG